MNEDGVSKVAKVLEDLILRQSSSQATANNVTAITTLSKTLLNLNVYSKSIHKCSLVIIGALAKHEFGALKRETVLEIEELIQHLKTHLLPEIKNETQTVVELLSTFPKINIAEMKIDTIELPYAFKRFKSTDEQLKEDLKQQLSILNSVHVIQKAFSNMSYQTNSTQILSVELTVQMLEGVLGVLELLPTKDVGEEAVRSLAVQIVRNIPNMKKPNEEDQKAIEAVISRITAQTFLLAGDIAVTQGKIGVIFGHTIDPNSLALSFVLETGQEMFTIPKEFPTNVFSPTELELSLHQSISNLTFNIEMMKGIRTYIQSVIRYEVNISSPGKDCAYLETVLGSILFQMLRDPSGNNSQNGMMLLSQMPQTQYCSDKSNLVVIHDTITNLMRNAIYDKVVIQVDLLLSTGIVAKDIESFPATYQVKEYPKLVTALRSNRASLDRIVTQLSGLQLKTSHVKGEKTKKILEVFDLVMQVIEVTSSNSFDDKITLLAEDIVFKIRNLNFEKDHIHIAFSNSHHVWIELLNKLVSSYQYKIAAFEQSKLSLVGGLNFVSSVTANINQFNFKALESKYLAQLEGSIRCNSLTGSIRLALSTIKQSPTSEKACSGSELVQKLRNAITMLTSTTIDVNGVEELTMEITKCSKNLDKELNPGERRSVDFTMEILISLSITFTSEITRYQQSLTYVVGKRFTPYDLGLNFVSEKGELIPFKSVDYQDNKSLNSTILLWQRLRFAFTSINAVLATTNRVENITTATGSSQPESVSLYFNGLQDYISILELGNLNFTLIKASFDAVSWSSQQVSTPLSRNFRQRLMSIRFSMLKLQAGYVTRFALMQQAIEVGFNTRMLDLNIEFKEMSEEGSITTTKVGVNKSMSLSEINSRIGINTNTMSKLNRLMDHIEASLVNDFTAISTATKTVSTQEFISTLMMITNRMSLNITDIDLPLFRFFLSFQLLEAATANEMEVLHHLQYTVRYFMLISILNQSRYMSFLNHTESFVTGKETSHGLLLTSLHLDHIMLQLNNVITIIDSERPENVPTNGNDSAMFIQDITKALGLLSTEKNLSFSTLNFFGEISTYYGDKNIHSNQYASDQLQFIKRICKSYINSYEKTYLEVTNLYCCKYPSPSNSSLAVTQFPEASTNSYCQCTSGNTYDIFFIFSSRNNFVNPIQGNRNTFTPS